MESMKTLRDGNPIFGRITATPAQVTQWLVGQGWTITDEKHQIAPKCSRAHLTAPTKADNGEPIFFPVFRLGDAEYEVSPEQRRSILSTCSAIYDITVSEIHAAMTCTWETVGARDNSGAFEWVVFFGLRSHDRLPHAVADFVLANHLRVAFFMREGEDGGESQPCAGWARSKSNIPFGAEIVRTDGAPA